MNNQELLNLLKQVLTMVGGLLTMYGVMTASQSSALISDISIALPALLSIGSIVWSVWSHWNMKKVPETAAVTLMPQVTK